MTPNLSFIACCVSVSFWVQSVVWNSEVKDKNLTEQNCFLTHLSHRHHMLGTRDVNTCRTTWGWKFFPNRELGKVLDILHECSAPLTSWQPPSSQKNCNGWVRLLGGELARQVSPHPPCPFGSPRGWVRRRTDGWHGALGTVCQRGPCFECL